MHHDRRPFLLLPLVAFVAIAPLLFRGCSCGHDFDFHIINWFEVARQITHGTLYPHWAFTPAWNAGEPRFVFYPPLSWLLGALLGLVMPWTWTPVAYTWIALTAAGLGFFYSVRPFSSANAALVAAAIYIANPYTLYTAYERTAYAELLAAAWLPLAVSALLRDRVSLPRVAVPVALLWLTNAPAAVMGSYALALLALLHLILPAPESSLSEGPADPGAPAPTTSRLRFILSSLAGVLLGLGLASFYLVPAAWERRYVRIDYAILPGLRPQDNFLFHRTPDPQHDEVLHLASIVAVVLIAMTIVALLLIRLNQEEQSAEHIGSPTKQKTVTERNEKARLERTQGTTNLMPYLAVMAAILIFLLTPLSLPVWKYLPELRFLQFPWRLLAVLAVVFGFALTQGLSRLRLRLAPTVVSSVIAILVLTWSAHHFFRQYCYPEDTVPERLAVFQSSNPGTDPTDEYTPLSADNDAANQSNPGYWLADSAGANAPPDSVPGPTPHRLKLAPTTPETLILNLRNYPAWRITNNGSPILTRLPRKDGLIAVPLPAGPTDIEIAYITLPDQRLGALFTLVSTMLLAALLLRRRA